MPTAETKAVKVRPATREKYERIGKLKRWKFVEVADAAADALIQIDPQLKSLRESVRVKTGK